MPTIPGFLGRNRLEWQYTKLRKWGRLRLLLFANEVAERLCFYTCLSFCPRGGGVCPSACWDTPPRQTPPLGRHPLQQTTTAADNTHPTGILNAPLHGERSEHSGALVYPLVDHIQTGRPNDHTFSGEETLGSSYK